ncbi:MAG: AAA family ATPase [Candidatus Aenigmatarchaeota archaeon]
MAEVIAILSGKGGVGKTTIAINIANVLSTYFRRKVLIVDTNFTTSHLGLSLGIFYPQGNLNKVLRDEMEIEEAIHNYSLGLDLLPLSLSVRDLEGIDITKFPRVLEKVNYRYDYIILDAAPGLGREAIISIKNADKVLYVALPIIQSIVDIVRTQEVVREFEKKEIGVILNMVRNKPYEVKDEEVESLTNLKVIGRIPYDERFLIANAHKLPYSVMFTSGKVYTEFLKICSIIANQKLEIRKGILSKFLEFLLRK